MLGWRTEFPGFSGLDRGQVGDTRVLINGGVCYVFVVVCGFAG